MVQQSPQLVEWLKSSDTPQATRLYFFIVTQPPGVPITMAQMKEAIELSDSSSISQLLTKIRHGRVPVDSSKGEYSGPIAINYDRHTKAYYDISKTTADNLDQQIPQSILSDLTRHVRSRTRSIDSAIGEGGLGKAISDGLLSGPEALELLKTVPIHQLRELRDNVDSAIASRAQLEDRKELQSGQQDTDAIEGLRNIAEE